VGGLTEVVEGGVTGMLVAPESPEALADAVSTLLKDEPRRAAMGRAGRLRVEQQFSLERMVEEYQKIYCSVSK
jgi:glycosyltransferase involved in cell wall biosynthesis